METLKFILGMNWFAVFIMVCATYYLLKFIVFVVPNRILRTIKVWKHGWPPAHLDADGDWKTDD